MARTLEQLQERFQELKPAPKQGMKAINPALLAILMQLGASLLQSCLAERGGQADQTRTYIRNRPLVRKRRINQAVQRDGRIQPEEYKECQDHLEAMMMDLSTEEIPIAAGYGIM